MKRYAEALSGCSTTMLGVSRAADIVAALTPPPTAPDAAAAAPAGESMTKKVARFVPGVAGAVAGAVAWPEHRGLGALTGHAIVNGGWEYLKGDKKKALCYAAVEGGGVAGALYYKGGRSPIIGWAIGALAGAAASYFVPGSPIKGLARSIRAKF